MNRRVALLLILFLGVTFAPVSAEQAGPVLPSSLTGVECSSASPASASAELALFAPEPMQQCVQCSLDRTRDCDAYCVQQGFLGGACCTCSTACLCTGQDPADVC